MKQLILAIVLLFVASDASAQLYLRLELGAAFTSPLTLNSDGYDSATRCDWITNPQRLEVGPECDEGIPLSEWRERLGRGYGFSSGAAVGYRWGSLRLEGEYFYRSTAYDDVASSEASTSDAVSIEKLSQEIDSGVGVVGDIESHSLLANLYYDFRTSSPWQPFIGAGIGVTRTTMDYASIWRRHHDPENITTFMDPLLRARLAGTTTIGQARLRDTILTGQVLGGINYRVNDQVLIGVIVRWVRNGDFESPETGWYQLRSHASSTGRGDQVFYRVRTPDTGYGAVNIGLTYQF